MTTRKQELSLALLLALAAPACGRRALEQAPARPVHVEAVRVEPEPRGLRYSASIQPYAQVPLAFKAAGYVTELRQFTGADGRPRSLQQGDAVARGERLARVNPAEYQQRVDQASAQLGEAEASLAKARADAARAEALYEGKALTRPDYDAARAALDGARARVAGAGAQFESAQLALEDTALVAPFDGMLLARNVEVGALVGVGSLGFSLADLTRVKAVFGVPDVVVQRVRIGTALQVKSDAMGTSEFPGRVTAVSPSADAQSRVFSVEVTIPNPKRVLKPGMIASVEVAAPDAHELQAGAPSVSVSAVVKGAHVGAFGVFVLEGAGESAVVRAREVALGRIAGNRVEVKSGLGQGERVVVSGASLLTDGDRVRVIPGEGE